MSKPRRLVNLVPPIALAILLAGCGPKKVTLSVDLTEFSFTPASWEIPAGSEVTITLVNKGSVEHEWVLMKKGYQVTIPFDADDEPQVFWEGEVDEGETMTFTFTAPTEPGEYQVVCGTPAHAEAGMLGLVTIK